MSVLILFLNPVFYVGRKLIKMRGFVTAGTK